MGELGAPCALGTGTDAVPGQGTRVQFQLCLQDSRRASQLYQIPIISEKIKAALSKILFFDRFFGSPLPPFPIFSPLLPPTHLPLLSVIHPFTAHTWRGSFLLPKPWELPFILIRNE